MILSLIKHMETQEISSIGRREVTDELKERIGECQLEKKAEERKSKEK